MEFLQLIGTEKNMFLTGHNPDISVPDVFVLFMVYSFNSLLSLFHDCYVIQVDLPVKVNIIRQQAKRKNIKYIFDNIIQFESN